MNAKEPALNARMLPTCPMTYISVSLFTFFLFVFYNSIKILIITTLFIFHLDPNCLQKTSLTQDSNNIIVVDMQKKVYVLYSVPEK